MKKKVLITMALSVLLAGNPVTSWNAQSIFAEASNTTQEGKYDTYFAEYRKQVNPELWEKYDDYVIYFYANHKYDSYQLTALNTYEKNKKLKKSTIPKGKTAMKNIVIPNYKKFLAGIKSIKPTQPELIAIHNKLIKATSIRLEALMLYQQYISSKNLDERFVEKHYTKMNAANALSLEFRQEISDYAEQF